MVPVVIMRGRATRSPAIVPTDIVPSSLGGSRAVVATLAALGPDLAPGGAAGWLSDQLGGPRAAVEALIESLQPGLPPEGPFDVNRLVAHAPVRLIGVVAHGAPTVTSVQRLDNPGWA